MNKQFIITVFIILFLAIQVGVSKNMPANLAPPTPPSEGPIPGIWLLIISGAIYGYKKIK